MFPVCSCNTILVIEQKKQKNKKIGPLFKRMYSDLYTYAVYAYAVIQVSRLIT